MSKRQPKVLLRDDAQRFVSAPNVRTRLGLRNRVALQLMWRCGLRVSEVCALTPAHVDLIGGYVLVQHGKGDRDRTVPMDGDTRGWCAQWLERRPGSPWFLPPLTGDKPINQSYYRLLCYRLSEQLGIWLIDGKERLPVHPHTLRHCYGTELAEEGLAPHEIAALMGHASIATTQVYLHIRPHALAQKIRQRAPVGV